MAESRVTRRGLLSGTASGVVLPAVLAAPHARADSTNPAPPTPASPSPAHASDAIDIVLQVNGTRLPLTIEPRTSLLDALREQTELTGTKKGCDRGACGACTVHIDGRRVVSCLTLAARCQGKAITTIEGLASGGDLHPVQAAFLHHDGFQCGYCTPGQIMSAAALIQEGHAGSDAEIREWMSGNICRCGAYPNIVAAVRDAARGA
jgi:xanthine dehydrogenase YagT iron-sulfur-binding subunit